jgi:hypothetical protein
MRSTEFEKGKGDSLEWCNSRRGHDQVDNWDPK